MSAEWQGTLYVPGAEDLQDVHLSSPFATLLLPKDVKVTYLSSVYVDDIPLHVRVGPLLDVWTSTPATASWFDAVLCSEDAISASQQVSHSVVGVLAGVTTDPKSAVAENGPEVTEVLFVATRSGHTHCPPTPSQSPPFRRSNNDTDALSFQEATVRINAILVSSKLLQSSPAIGLTPPPSPSLEPKDYVKAVFVDDPICHQHVTPTVKRKSLADTFEEAGKRRRVTKKNMGGNVAAAAAAGGACVSSKPQSASPLGLPPTRSDSRPASSNASQPATSTVTPSSQPATKPLLIDPALEQKNKDTLSRLILAGLRLHNLSQLKAPSTPAEVAQNEVFKLTYHATLKAATFTFRSHMSTRSLAEHTDILRANVDRLLDMFCGDPLAASLAGDEMTGSGRTPFRTPLQDGDRAALPFPASVERVESAEGKSGEVGLGVSTGEGKGRPLEQGKGKEKQVVKEVFMTPIRRRKREAGF